MSGGEINSCVLAQLPQGCIKPHTGLNPRLPSRSDVAREIVRMSHMTVTARELVRMRHMTVTGQRRKIELIQANASQAI